jgi:fatty-acyl-CoA synthase
VRHRSIAQAAVYAVPDRSSGDRLVAALVLFGDLTPEALEEFLDEQQDLGPKQRPLFVRIIDELPRTATNKVLKRESKSQGVGAADPLWTRAERGTAYSVAWKSARQMVMAIFPRAWPATRWRIASGACSSG